LTFEADKKNVLPKSSKMHVRYNVLPNFIYLNIPFFLKALRKFSMNLKNYGITNMQVHAHA
jgi:hypothetical protein